MREIRFFSILICLMITMLNANDLKSEYFTLSQGCKWGELNDFGTQCVGNNDGGGDSYGYYKLTQPLHLKGKFVLYTTYPSECESPEIAVRFLNDNKGFEFLESARLSMDKQSMQKMESMLPKWFLEGFLGEVVFEVSFEVENRNTIIDFQGDNAKVPIHNDLIGFIEEEHACGIGRVDRIYVKNIKITKLSEKPSNRADYEDIMLLALKGYEPIVDKDINLYQTPNGQILTTIPITQKDMILIVGADDRSYTWRWLVDNAKSPYTDTKSNTKWKRVIYFPAGTTSWKKAFIGYINAQKIELMGFDKAQIKLDRINKALK